MTYNVLMGTLNPTHSLTRLLHMQAHRTFPSAAVTRRIITQKVWTKFRGVYEVPRKEEAESHADADHMT